MELNGIKTLFNKLFTVPSISSHCLHSLLTHRSQLYYIYKINNQILIRIHIKITNLGTMSYGDYLGIEFMLQCLYNTYNL